MDGTPRAPVVCPDCGADHEIGPPCNPQDACSVSLWRRASAAGARSRSRRFGAPPAGRQQASKATTTTRRLFRCAAGARPLEAVHGRAPAAANSADGFSCPAVAPTNSPHEV